MESLRERDNQNSPAHAEAGPYACETEAAAHDVLEQRFELTPAVLDVLDALVVVLDGEGRIVLFNQACERATGYTSPEVVGSHIWDRLLPSGEAASVREVFESLRSGDYPNSHENHWISRTGNERLIAWSNTAIADPDGTVRYVVGTGIDVTEKRLAEEGIRWRTEDLTLINTLTESANRGDDLRAIARLLSLGTRNGLSIHGSSLYVLDESGATLVIEGFNFKPGVIEKLEKIAGATMPSRIMIHVESCPPFREVLATNSALNISGPEAVRDFLRLLISASDAPFAIKRAGLAMVPAMQKLLEIREIAMMPLVSEGEPLAVMATSTAEPLNDIQRGRLTSIARQVAGILRRRRAEQALRMSEASLGEAQRIAGIGNWSWDLLRDERHWSDQVYRLLGLSHEDHKPTYDDFIEAVHPDDREKVKTALDKALRLRRRYGVEHRIVRPDGSVRVIRERGELKFDESGKPVQMIGTMQDVTAESRSTELRNVLLAIAEAVNSTDGLEELLATIHSELGRLIDTTNFYVALFDEQSGTYSFPYHVDEYDDDSALGPTYLGKSLTDYVRRTGEPLLVDKERYEQLLASGEVEQIGAPSTAWLGAPLRSGGRDIGVVAVQNYGPVSPYTPYDLTLMSFVSDNIAMAIGRKLAEEQVRQRLHMEETISDIASGLMRHGVRQTTQAIGEALASVGSLLGASHSFMWLDGPSESESTNTFEWRADGVPPLPVEFPAVMEHSLPVLLSATSRQGYFRIDEPAALPPGDGSLRHLMESNGLNTLLAVPVSDGTDLTGFVGVLDAQPGARSTHSVTFLRTLSTALSSALERRRADAALRASFESLRSTVEGTVDALSKLGEARDPYTAGHQQRVAEISCAIAEEMGFAPDRIEGIRVASKLHDIGKIHVPGEILSKPGKLNELEFGIIKTHPKVGYDILRAVVFPWPVAKVALQHHERLDGSGYPDGLKGDDILPEAKIVAVSDVVEAMCTHRPYRPALTIEEAIEELASNRGRLYAPEVVDACLKLMRSGKMNPGGGRP